MAVMADTTLYAVMRRTTGNDWVFEIGSTGIRYASTQFMTRDLEAAQRQCNVCSAVDEQNGYEVITFTHSNV